jgi:hypothetical protein
VLGAGLMLTPAQGKGGPKCGKLCKSEIAAAKALCTQTAKKDKHRCQQAARRDTLTACKSQPTPRSQCLPGSADAAFVD